MEVLSRIANYLWPYKRTLIVSFLCAMGVAACWCMNLSAMGPVAKILFENDSLQEYVDQRIDDANERIAIESKYLEELGEHELSKRVKLQARISDATWTLHGYTMLDKYVMPFIPTDKFNTMSLLVFGLFLGTLLKCAFVYAQELLVGSVVNRTANDIRQDCFETVLKLDLQTVERKGTPTLMSHMTNDVQEMTLAISTFGTTIIREPLKAMACVGAAFFINWRLTLMATLLVPLIGVFLARFGRKLKKAARSAMQSVATIYECITETTDLFRVVSAFSGERRHRERFREANEDYYQNTMKCVRISALLRPTSELIGLFIVVVAFTPGTYMVLRNTDNVFGIQLASEPMSITELLTLYVLLAGVLDPVRKLSSVFGYLRRGMVGAERVFSLVDTPSRVSEPTSPRRFARHQKSISFEDISFHYPGDHDHAETDRPPALEHVDLDVSFGEVIAVVGSNGSGKSTLLSLLPRFMDVESGRIRIDNVDIQEYQTSDLRSQIGLVSQETLLFNDTILENIRYGRASANRAEIVEAAKQAHAWNFISSLPDGLNTKIGARGGRLSGGQRQRIALARAIVRDPSILILDEATSAVDAESEELIHRVLKTFSQGRTVFIITHVLSEAFLDLVDRIVVMDQGKVAAIGSHDDLLHSCPLYQRLTQSAMPGRAAA